MGKDVSSEKEISEFSAGIEECRDTIFFDHCSQPWCNLSDYTYCLREQIENQLRREIQERLGTNTNILIVGDAGVGKSTFVRKLINDLENDKQNIIQTYYLDLNDQVGEKSLDSVYVKLGVYLDQFLELFGSGSLPDNVVKNIPPYEAHRRRIALLSELPLDISNKKGTHPVLVIDDIDYVNRQFFPRLVEAVSLLLNSPHILVVWICRPPSLSQLENLLNPRAKAPFTRMNPIRVDPLNVRMLLVGRLWPLIDIEKSHPDIGILMREESLNKNGKSLRKKLIDDLNTQYGGDYKITMKQIIYPFGRRLETFLSAVSNNDIRIIFGMAYQHIIEVQNNPEKYRKYHGQWNVIDRATNLLCLGMTDKHYNPIMPDEEQDLWKIINLHEVQGEHGRSSLLHCILQWCVVSGHTDENYFKVMKELGFSSTESTGGISYCEWARLIEPRVVRSGQYPYVSERRIERQIPNHYQLTERGSYYLRYLNEWPEYIWGEKTRYNDNVFRSTIHLTSIDHDLVELLGHYVLADLAIHSAAKTMLNASNPMLPNALCLPEDVIITYFLKYYGANYYSGHRKSRTEVYYENLLTDEMVNTALYNSVNIPGSKRPKKLVTLLQKGMVEIRRESVRKAYQVRGISIPNKYKLDISEIVQTIINNSWLEETKHSKLKKKINTQILLEEALRVLQNQ